MPELGVFYSNFNSNKGGSILGVSMGRGESGDIIYNHSHTDIHWSIDIVLNGSKISSTALIPDYHWFSLNSWTRHLNSFCICKIGIKQSQSLDQHSDAFLHIKKKNWIMPFMKCFRILGIKKLKSSVLYSMLLACPCVISVGASTWDT